MNQSAMPAGSDALTGIFTRIGALVARILPRGGRATTPAEPPVPSVSFRQLAEQGIVFYDHADRPLYSLSGNYETQAEILTKCLLAFDELVPEVRMIPMPRTGRYADTPIDQVLYNVGETDLLRFLAAVQQRPGGYAGKHFRLTEAFAGWVVSGTPGG